MRKGYHADSALAAGAEFEALAKEFDRTHPGAVGSQREGMAETLAVLRLGVPPTLAAHAEIDQQHAPRMLTRRGKLLDLPHQPVLDRLETVPHSGQAPFRARAPKLTLQSAVWAGIRG